jgi:uncharacterized protein (DUF488 family)
LASELVLFSVGYQGRSLPSLCELLVQNAVKMLIDIRERAWSNRPEFRKGALRKGLETSGISYDHLKMAGNPFRPRNGQVIASSRCFEQYKEYLAASPEIAEEVLGIARHSRIALFCYEASASACHRGVLAAAVVHKCPELEVVHL